MTETNEPNVDIQLWSNVQNRADAEKEEADGFMDELQQMEIVTQDDLEFAAQILAETKGKINQLEAMRGQATQPLTQTLEVIRSWFRPTISMLKKAEAILKTKIAEARRRSDEKQQKALEQAAKASMSGDQATAAVSMQQATNAELHKVGGLSFRESWDYDIVEIGRVPPQYLIVVVNDTAVRAVIKEHQGNTNIPGIRVRKVTGVASRSG